MFHNGHELCLQEIAESYLPNATIVIDKFHVVRYVTWALENA
ncbi:MAG: transposase [Eubacterium ventriosum]